jgi:diacylglycerol kinase (ATP)
MGDEHYFQRRVRSFGYALQGIATLFRSQAHAKVHLAATVVVVGLGFLLEVSPGEWVALVLSITLVWVAEGFNTALEFVVDLASPERHALAGKAKDVAAGSVLLASIGTVVVAMLVFVPRIWHLF